MRDRTLGKDLQVSAVGLGCMGLSHAYGAPVERKEAVRLLQEEVDMGYTFFDTAEVYGTAENPHDNEELLCSILSIPSLTVFLFRHMWVRMLWLLSTSFILLSMY